MLQTFNLLGALYFDNTSQFEKEDDVIFPGKEHTYYWEVTPEVAPHAADPPCVTYTYFSHNDIVKDYNTGLIGTLLICKNGMFIFIVILIIIDNMNQFISSELFPFNGQIDWITKGLQITLFILKLSQPDIVCLCSTGSLDESGKQVHFHQEFTLLFGVFDESNTWYSKRDAPLQENVKYTINGFTNGSVPGKLVKFSTMREYQCLYKFYELVALL